MPDLYRKSTHLLLIIIHVIIGITGKYAPGVPGYFYLAVTILFIYDIIIHRDRGARAGFYALYIIGFEIVYRISGANIAWEAGKYFSIGILLVGLIINQKKVLSRGFFLLLFFLLIPALFLTSDPNPEDLRQMIMFNLLGPVTLVLSGMYFYKRKVVENVYLNGLRFAFLPAFALVVVISLKSGLSGLQFIYVGSSPDAAGGFGANQVSTVIGWFLLMVLLFRIIGKNITPLVWLDWGMIAILLIRGLVTLSRGGMMAFVIAFFMAFIVLWVKQSSFRRKTIKMMPYVIFGLFFFIGTIWYTNKITNNYLFYRYTGVTNSELRTGIPAEDSSYLTGRDEIMEGDIAAFKKFPILGVGYGMAAKWHAIYFGHEAAAHTEYSRLLSENGMLGLIFMIISFVWLPVLYFLKTPSPLSRAFFVAFLFLSLLTMFHAAMRLVCQVSYMGFRLCIQGCQVIV
ncbi:O-antigen ligase family protein [Marinilabilia salmonicolor]|uniref:O-antigen ligase family protein n=1 Tax=Marinilabilia salmonicolor TaxID=989 RepID=UPI000467F0C3|nr:O-antigen ligase family protein [Marinilabilia salmonicolor]